MNLFAALPLIVPLVAALLMLAVGDRPRLRRSMARGAGALQLGVVALVVGEVLSGEILVTHVGGWTAPLGIALVVDPLSALLLALSAVLGLVVTFFARTEGGGELERTNFHPLLQLLLLGVNGAFVAGDLFNLYVWFEVLLCASFVLLVVGRKPDQLRVAYRYVAINLVASFLFLIATGLVYGLTGTLNLAHITEQAARLEETSPLMAVSMLFVVAFGIKAALFPLFFWLPGAYVAPAPVIGAVFAGLVTKVGVYALIRVVGQTFAPLPGHSMEVLLVLALATMVIGVLGAVCQSDIRRILAFHSISQTGYMVLGLALGSELALVGALVFIVHHALVKSALFLIAGVVEKEAGSGDLDRIGGLLQARPKLAVAFGFAAASLVGLPPLSGFWAKLLVVRASFEVGAWLAAGGALVVGLLTLFSMTKVWSRAFWKPHPNPGRLEARSLVSDTIAPRRSRWAAGASSGLAIAALVVASAVVGIFPEPLVDWADSAARAVLDGAAYRAAVLGGDS